MSDENTCPDCLAPMSEHEQGYCPYKIETGERIVRSEVTDTVYRVTKWVDKGDGRLLSLHKEEIEVDQQSGGRER